MFKSTWGQVIKYSKAKTRGDEIGCLFSGVVAILILSFGLFHLTPIGKTIDDFAFAFLFGWMKYLLYFLGFCWVVPLCFRYHLKVKPLFFLALVLLLVISCWSVQTIFALVAHKNEVWTNYDEFNLIKITTNYFSSWWNGTIIENYHGFFSQPISYHAFNQTAFFPVYATGGMISNVLTGIFSYGYFITNFAVNFMVLFLVLCWIFFKQPLFIIVWFKKKIIKIKKVSPENKKSAAEKFIFVSKDQSSNDIPELKTNQKSALKPTPIVEKELKTNPVIEQLQESGSLSPFGKIVPKTPKNLNPNKGGETIRTSLENSVFNEEKPTHSKTNDTYMASAIVIDKNYILPSLKQQEQTINSSQQQANEENALLNKSKLLDLFEQFSIKGQIENYHIGSTITKYEVSLTPGVRVNKITSLEEDIKLTLGSSTIRIEAPIPGKSLVGIEVANQHIIPVSIQDVMAHVNEKNDSRKLLFAIGKDSLGKYIFNSLEEMPHLLIAGSTGSGKSVFINTLLISLLLRYKPHEIKLLLIDPKWVELVAYNNIPHLLAPVINDAKVAPIALQVVLLEMTRRYQLLAKNSSRNINSYNSKLSDAKDKLPYYVVIIDELADLMVQNSKEIEEGIMRITQMGRAAGIHLIVATQRPSTNIITGVIKNNIPSRIAFRVSSWIDSRTIVDTIGAEKLLGKGDMLFVGPGSISPVRIQAPWMSEEEVLAVLNFIKTQSEPQYDENFINKMTTLQK